MLEGSAVSKSDAVCGVMQVIPAEFVSLLLLPHHVARRPAKSKPETGS
uniref:Uncharacterized protein n=1 Tax=Anguilla anguilla TaxID=7936 RepID=A0A0E9SXA5_ANGAN